MSKLTYKQILAKRQKWAIQTFGRHEATITSESGEPKYTADCAAEGRALNPESPDRSASSDGGLMANEALTPPL